MCNQYQKKLATTAEVAFAVASFDAKFTILLHFCKMGRVIFCLCSKRKALFFDIVSKRE